VIHQELTDAYYQGLEYLGYRFKAPMFICPKCARTWERGYRDTLRVRCPNCNVRGLPYPDKESKDTFDLIHGYIFDCLFVKTVESGLNPHSWKSLDEHPLRTDEKGKTEYDYIKERIVEKEELISKKIGKNSLSHLKKRLGI